MKDKIFQFIETSTYAGQFVDILFESIFKKKMFPCHRRLVQIRLSEFFFVQIDPNLFNNLTSALKHDFKKVICGFLVMYFGWFVLAVHVRVFKNEYHISSIEQNYF